MFDSDLPLSFYREIATLDKNHRICFVQHIETGKVYLKKTMKTYNLHVFEALFKHPVKNIPRIYALYESNNELTIIEEYVSLVPTFSKMSFNSVVDFSCSIL